MLELQASLGGLAPSLHFKIAIFKSLSSGFTLSFFPECVHLPLPSSFKDPCNTFGANMYNLEQSVRFDLTLNLLTISKSLFPYKAVIPGSRNEARVS